MTGEGGRVFLSDEPIESPEQDKFDHREYVDALEKILENADPRWNIGVFGKWGTGKSSIIKLLFDRLEENPAFESTVCVEFDAWTHAEESIRTDLLLGIDYELGKKTDTEVEGEYGILGEDYITEELYDITEETGSEDLSYREYTARLLAHSKLVTGVVVGAALILAVGVLANLLSLVGVLNPAPDLMATVNSILQIAILPLFLSLFIFMAKQVEDATSNLRQRYPRKEWSGAYEQLFEEMLTELVEETEKEKVIISVDNLDRCESSTVYDVLVSLKTFMENDSCIYIIPCDDEALLSHVQSIDNGEYFEKHENEREFLRKLFQAHVRVPPFTSEAISDYADELKGQLEQDLVEDYDDEVLSVITKAYARNPRRIKQAFNRLTTLRMLAEEMEATERMREGAITDNLPFLAKISILQEDFPEFYRALQANPRLLDEFNDYFAGRVSDSEREEELAAYFDPDENDNGSVEGLRNFLRTTRYITDDNPRRFIYLSEPSYALTLGGDERFVQDLRTGQVDKLRDELKLLFEGDEDFTPYLEAIRDTLNEWSHLDSELFNIIEGLMEVFDALDEDAQLRVAAVVSEYLVSADRRYFLEDLDPHLSFPLLLKLPSRDSRILFNAYGKLAADSEALHENVLDAFVSHSDQIPRSARRPLSESLTNLRQNQQIDEFKRALDIIHSSATAREKYATTSLLKAAVELIELINNQRRFVDYEYYTKFDRHASTEARSAFVEKLLDLRNEVDDNNAINNLNQNLADILLDLEPDLNTRTSRRLYEEFKGIVRSPSSNEKHLVETVFYYYDDLVRSDQDEFRQQCVNQIQNWSGPTRQYLRWAEQYDVPLLDSEDAVEAALDPFPDQNSNADLLTNTILPLIPEEFDEEVTAKRLLDVLDSSNNSHVQLGVEMFLTAPERFSNVQASVVDKCLTRANRTNDTNSKQTYLMAVSEVFTELEDSDQELFLSRLTELVRGNNRDKQAFARVWREVEDDLEPGHRRTIGQNVVSVLEDEASDQNQQVPNDDLVKVLQSVTDDLGTNANEEFIQRLSDKLTDGDIGWKQKQDIVRQLAEFEDLAGQEDLVLTRIEGMLKQNSQDRLHQTTEKKLDMLKQSDKIDNDRIKEIKDTHLET